MTPPTTATFWSTSGKDSARLILVSTGTDNDAREITPQALDALHSRLDALRPFAMLVQDDAVVRRVSSVLVKTGDGAVCTCPAEPAQVAEAAVTLAAERGVAAVVAVVDGTTGENCLASWLGSAPDSVHLDCCSVSFVVIHGNRVVLETVNDVCHLPI